MLPVSMDTSHLFNQVFTKTSFNSFASFEELFEQFQARTGYSYRVKSSNDFSTSKKRLNKEALRYSSITYVCSQYKQKVRARRKSIKSPSDPFVGCKSFLSLSCTKGQIYVIRRHLEHNHTPLLGCGEDELPRHDLKITDVATAATPSGGHKMKCNKKKQVMLTTADEEDSPPPPPPPPPQEIVTRKRTSARRAKKVAISNGEPDPGNISFISEQLQDTAAPNSSATTGQPRTRICVPVPSTQQAASQTKSIEKSQEFVAYNHTTPALKKRKLFSVSERLTTVDMANSPNENQANNGVTPPHSRMISPAASSNMSFESRLAKIPERQTAVECPAVYRRQSAAHTYQPQYRKTQYFNNKNRASVCNIPPAADNCVESEENADPICVIEDVQSVAQMNQLSATSALQLPPQESRQPQGKKIFILADHQKTVMSSLALLWKGGKLCDAGISNGVSTVMVHKVVLASVCPKLLTVFGADILSQTFLQINLPREVTTEALNAFAEYLYNGILDLDPNILLQLTVIAKQLDMKEFEQLCDSQLPTSYQPEHNQIQPNVSTPLSRTPANFSSSVHSSLSKAAESTQVIHITDEGCDVEVMQAQENEVTTSVRQSEASSDVTKQSNCNENFYLIPKSQLQCVARENSRKSLANPNLSRTIKKNIGSSKIPCKTVDSSSDNIFVVPLINPADARTNTVHSSNLNPNFAENSQSYDLSPVSCIVEKMCSQPSLIGKSFYKPSSSDSTSSNRKSVASNTSFQENAADVVSIDLTDEIT
ncbi:uncharacterized protein LOC115209895 [Argonauta hians]